jgi:2-polyprenyl-6-methoxyphenol hydroxylase-like FAD-dependent oxidoreductase
MPAIDTAVLIVGAGPTGLTLALELALRGVPFRIIDAQPAPSDKSRALILQPRTLELLRHSITAQATERGVVGIGAQIYVNARRVLDTDISDLGFDDTAFPQPVWISQAVTESLLEARLREAYGAKVERGVGAKAFEELADCVRVTLARGSSEETVTARYVAGCDGAHSTVRHAAGLSFEGAPYPRDFLLCDATLDWPLASAKLSLFLGPTGIMVLFPMADGSVRLVASAPPTAVSTAAGHGASADAPTLADMQAVLDANVPGKGALRDPVWLARFRLHHRSADRFRRGRFFVLGDAAHIHSPAGGQGMNTGIQDAANLGWKLARALRLQDGAGGYGGADALLRADELLRSYHAERHPVGQTLLRGTDRLFGYAASTSWLFLLWRNFFAAWILPWVIGNRARRARLFHFVSELGIRYRRSEIVGTAAAWRGTVRGGDRAPDGRVRKGGAEGDEMWLMELKAVGDGDQDGHQVLLFQGKGTSSSAEEVDRVKAIVKEAGLDFPITLISTTPSDGALLDVDGHLHTAYGFAGPGYVVVRPDGYVGHIGPMSALEELRTWLKQY